MLPSDCKVGISKNHYGKTEPTILDEANFHSHYYHDLVFAGTFCPKENGMYRIIFEGSVYDKYESLYSYYSFNSIQQKSRTSPYHYLMEKTCYPYQMFQSIDGMYDIHATLFFQYENNSKVVMTSQYSYSCQKLICFNGSKDPRCFKFKTKSICHLSFKSSYFIIFLFLSQ